MLNEKNIIEATKYKVLINWLREQLCNNKKIKEEDLELLLFSLGIEIKHKLEIKNEVIVDDKKIMEQLKKA